MIGVEITRSRERMFRGPKVINTKNGIASNVPHPGTLSFIGSYVVVKKKKGWHKYHFCSSGLARVATTVNYFFFFAKVHAFTYHYLLIETHEASMDWSKENMRC